MLIGGRWICNPMRIVSLADEHVHSKAARNKNRGDTWDECLIYTSGGNEMEFANKFLDYSLARTIELHDGRIGKNFMVCEVHIFNPNGLVCR